MFISLKSLKHTQKYTGIQGYTKFPNAAFPCISVFIGSLGLVDSHFRDWNYLPNTRQCTSVELISVLIRSSASLIERGNMVLLGTYVR